MRKIMFLAVLVMVSATLVGCAGTMYYQQRVLPDGTILTQGGRTGVFGTDNSFVYITPPTQSVVQVPVGLKPLISQEPQRIERTYSIAEDSWKQKCPSPKQRHSIVHVNKKETWTEVVPPVVQPVQSAVTTQSEPVFGFGTNTSVGNLTAPVAAGAAGYALGQKWRRPDQTNITQTGGGGGGATAISNAEAEARAIARQRQIQLQDQSQRQGVDIGIDID